MISTKMYFKMLSLYQSYFVVSHSVRCSYSNRGKVHKLLLPKTNISTCHGTTLHWVVYWNKTHAINKRSCFTIFGKCNLKDGLYQWELEKGIRPQVIRICYCSPKIILESVLTRGTLLLSFTTEYNFLQDNTFCSNFISRIRNQLSEYQYCFKHSCFS